MKETYLILSGEGNIDTEYQFCSEFDTLEEAEAFFNKLKSDTYSETYLYIYKAIKIKEL